MSARLKWTFFLQQNHIKCCKLTQSCCSFVCGCSQCMDDCLPPGGATVQSPSYIISCVAMAMKHTASMAKLGMQVSGDIRAKLYCAAERNLSLGQQESRGEILNARKGWEKETQRRKRGENCTHTHGVHLHCDKAVYCTFVSRTDIILSLASLTFSLFPHTLMWGSAGRKKGKQWEIEEHVFNVRVSQCW